MPTIYLYAEVLANIRQANLYASLQTHKNEHTRIDIASDKKTVTVSHDGQTACIYLPTEIRGTAEVNIPIERGKEMSVRLELADITTMPSAKDAVGNEGPWLATDLSSEADIRCRLCTTEVRQKGMPLDFKDLPSQHWAEMMDFWHCHRPHDATVGSDEDAKLAADYKGYGSSTKLKAAPGIAFVDTMSFLLDATSCRNIQKSGTELYCSGCKALLGADDSFFEGWRLYKSSLSIKASLEADWESFPPVIFISSQLLSMIESSAARKFVVHADDRMPGVLIWVFNPDIRYASSRRSELVVRALKVFYQEAKDPHKLLDEHQASLEELLLPRQIFQSFKSSLVASTDLLPPSARRFQEWTIGSLDRYERTESGRMNYFDGIMNKPEKGSKD